MEQDDQFLKHLIAFESAPTETEFDRLTGDGIPRPAPAEVPTQEIGVVLWRVILGLARYRVFLSSTNHLSDRELYEVLWHTVLREEVTILLEGDTGAWQVPIPGDDPESTNYLTYYASEEDREQWSREFPDLVLPPRKWPLHDRDGDLPHAADDPPCVEARDWLQRSSSPSALATNRFGTTAAASKFIDRLYAEGASCVIVDQVTPTSDGEPYADELVVVLPADSRRKALVECIEHEGRPDTVDGERHFIDDGRGAVRLWWD